MDSIHQAQASNPGQDGHIHDSIYLEPADRAALQAQFETPLFAPDRRQLELDLEVIYGGKLASTLFSWWCVNLPNAVIGGQYQASLETLASAWHLKNDSRAPSRAKELLFEQAALPRWTEPNYGDDMGHDLASSHHCRGFAAGMDIAQHACTPKELQMLAESYARQVREPYLCACSGDNPYLLGTRNTNWLAHLSGSVLLAELALAAIELNDPSILALAKANVLRYVDAIRPDGSLPEQGDYFHYGMEPALLSLHAWSIHAGNDILRNYSQTGLSHALRWPLAVTDPQGCFWADFGDTHTGFHEASRTVGYLMARHLDDAGGQWLGDTVRSREPLAPLFRPPLLQPAKVHPRIYLTTSEALVAVNLRDQSLAFRGGPCRGPGNPIPHRHYDAGSLIYRLHGTNVVCDTGFDKYTDDYWNDFDHPNHVRSAAYLHNILLAGGRGHRREDAATGLVFACSEDMPGIAQIIWKMQSNHPGISSWERQILIFEDGPLVVVDRAVSQAATSLSLLWHLHARPTLLPGDGWTTDIIRGRVLATTGLRTCMGDDQPSPYVRIDAPVAAGREICFVSIIDPLDSADTVSVDWNTDRLIHKSFRWHIRHRFLESC